jgi:hypothetical protein
MKIELIVLQNSSRLALDSIQSGSQSNSRTRELYNGMSTGVCIPEAPKSLIKGESRLECQSSRVTFGHWLHKAPPNFQNTGKSTPSNL